MLNGNQNIIIQGINDSTITLNVNGEISEIKTLLVELQAFLQKHQTQSIQYADKIYNISHINEANFGIFTGKKAFNEQLSKALIEALQPYNSAARDFLKTMIEFPVDWETKANTSDNAQEATDHSSWETYDSSCSIAKEIIVYSFVGVIGIQLSKLMAIGQEEPSEAKQREYIQKCIHICKWTLDLLCFALISKLWDCQKEKHTPLTAEHTKILKLFFDSKVELSTTNRVVLFKTLLAIFSENKLPLPMAELSNMQAQLQADSPFYQCCQKFQALNRRLDNREYTLLDCFEAEKQTAFFLGELAFLTRYRMASVKRIAYQQARNTSPMYLHSYAALGIDTKTQKNAEKVDYTPITTETDAILLYQGEDYRESLNLFPFVIDYNALTFESGAKICFYCAKDIESDCLRYTFLEDNSLKKIEKKGILKPYTPINELMIDNEKRKILNLDNVVAQFQAAQKCITGA